MPIRNLVFSNFQVDAVYRVNKPGLGQVVGWSNFTVTVHPYTLVCEYLHMHRKMAIQNSLMVINSHAYVCLTCTQHVLDDGKMENCSSGLLESSRHVL